MIKMRLSKRGFSLVEIMVVLLVIAILVALAIPNLLRAKISSNETNVTAVLRTLSSGLHSYASANPGPCNNCGYPADLTALAPPGEPPYIPLDLAVLNPSRSGYNLTYIQEDVINNTGYGFRIIARPIILNRTGVRVFAVNAGGVICGNPNNPADPGPYNSDCPDATWAAIE